MNKWEILLHTLMYSVAAKPDDSTLGLFGKYSQKYHYANE